LDVCSEEADSCIASFGHECSSDANVCTDDVCNGLGTCIHVLNSAPCDDGVFCNGQDFCSDGLCQLSIGNPCSASDPCADSCDGLKGTTFKFRDTNAEFASANGIASVTIKRNTNRDEVRAKLKMRGTDIPAVVDETQLTASLLVGGSPTSGRCGSVTGLACSKKGTSKLTCSNWPGRRLNDRDLLLACRQDRNRRDRLA
jgi:hypothetical protein